MTDETNDEDLNAAPATPEEQSAQDTENESAFAAGFNESRGDTPDEEPAANTEANDDAPAAESDEQANEETPPAVLFAGKTEAEIQALFEKIPGLEARFSEETRRLHGKYGDIQGRLQKSEERFGTPFARDISVEDFEDLNSEYGLELTEKLVKGLRKFLSAPAPQQAPDAQSAPASNSADVDTRITQAIAAADERAEKRLLTVLHNDWQSVLTSPEFASRETRDDGTKVITGGWMATLSQEDRDRYQYSPDATVVAEAVTKFKEWKSSRQDKSNRNKQRLERTLTPTGGVVPKATLDDEAAFLAGFNGARGRLNQ